MNMIDINIIRTNRSLVENNLKKKYQEEKLPLIDKILSLDTEVRELKTKGDNLRQERNKKSDEIGLLYREKKTTEAESIKEEVKKINDSLVSLEEKEENLSKELKELMMTIFQLVKMIHLTLKSKGSENQSFQTMQFHIIQILWQRLMV